VAIEFKCPGCGLTVEAPDSAGGKKSKCPGCGAAVTIPAALPPAEDEYVDVEKQNRPPVRSHRRSSRPDEPEPQGKPRPSGSARQARRPDEDSAKPRSGRSPAARRPDEEDSKPRHKKRDKGASTGPNYMLFGGIAVVFVALVAVLIILMRGENSTPGTTPSPGSVSASGGPAASLSPTPTPVVVDDSDVIKALKTIAETNALARDSAIARNGARIFKGGKQAVRVLIESGVGSDESSIRWTANFFLCALTGEEGKQDLLYSTEEKDIEKGRTYWKDWWEQNKTKSFADIVRPALASSKPSRNRELTAVALGYVREKEIVPLIFDMMSDPETTVRSFAYESMLRLLKNDRIAYNSGDSLANIAVSVKALRDWWDGVKDKYDFANPEKSLEGLAPARVAPEPTPAPTAEGDQPEN